MHVAQEPTDCGMVVPGHGAWEARPARRRRPWMLLVGVLGLVAVVYAVLNLITVRYYGLLPGDAQPVDGKRGAVTINGAHTGSGKIFFATVFEQRRVSEWDRLTYPYTHPDRTLVPIDAITGGKSPSVYNQANDQAMSESQQFAKVAAVRRLGRSVPELGDGAAVVQVGRGTPAEANLRDGDVITAVDGRAVAIAPDATVAIRSRHPGDLIGIDVRRPGPRGSSAVHVTIHAAACGAKACPTDPGRTFVGVALITDNRRYVLPPDVSLGIATANVGGPSAGLAFALGALDALTTNNITGGHTVATTGTIDAAGKVGEVGGVRQKVIAVDVAGADYFLVPRAELREARAAARGRHVKVIPVDDLEQALSFLRSIDGDLSGIPAIPPLAPPAN